jgi:hypothetical protein
MNLCWMILALAALVMNSADAAAGKMIPRPAPPMMLIRGG